MAVHPPLSCYPLLSIGRVHYFPMTNTCFYAMDFGFNWVILSNLQLDIAANLSLQEMQNHMMVSGGIAWLIS